MTALDDLDAMVALQVIEIIRPFLAGRDPAVQSAILADLLAQWVAGHHPLARTARLADHIDLVMALVPICESQQFGDAGHPGRKDMTEEDERC
jgi:hypothetical protein